MKFRLFLIALCAVSSANAQLTIHHCEDFSIGTTLRFQQCDPAALAGPAGAALTWDFTGLTPLADTTTEWMVSPSATTAGSLFPTANLVEKYSNGTFVYVHTNADSSFLVGYLDTVNSINISYSKPNLFALRPISYGTSTLGTYLTDVTFSSFHLHGSGIDTLAADAYGTLKLPNGTYPNTLRLKITQTENDTELTSRTVSVTTMVTYVWFDDSHTSALLKIDSTNSPGGIQKTVQYLIDETTAVPSTSLASTFSCYPNPASDQLWVNAPRPGTLCITNTLGQIVLNKQVLGNQSLSLALIPPGIYYLNYRSGTIVRTQTLVIRH